MNKKIITGAIIAIAAGLATFFYRRRRHKLNAVTASSYNPMDDTSNENYF